MANSGSEKATLSWFISYSRHSHHYIDCFLLCTRMHPVIDESMYVVFSIGDDVPIDFNGCMCYINRNQH